MQENCYGIIEILHVYAVEVIKQYGSNSEEDQSKTRVISKAGQTGWSILGNRLSVIPATSAQDLLLLLSQPHPSLSLAYIVRTVHPSTPNT
jgi:hypothetical protein